MQNSYDNYGGNAAGMPGGAMKRGAGKCVTYAGFWVRLAAYLIDSVIVAAGLLVVRLLLSAVMSALQATALGGNILFHYTLKDILLYVCQVLYFILCTYCTGTTLGKRAMNLRVVDADGEGSPSLLNVVYRETVGRFLCSLPAGIGYLIAGLDKEKRGIHDMLCDTRVVYAKKVTVYPVYRPMPGSVPFQGNVPTPGSMPFQGNVPTPGNMPVQNNAPMPEDRTASGNTSVSETVPVQGDMAGKEPASNGMSYTSAQGVPLTTPWASKSGPYHLVRPEEMQKEAEQAKEAPPKERALEESASKERALEESASKERALEESASEESASEEGTLEERIWNEAEIGTECTEKGPQAQDIADEESFSNREK